MTPSDPMERSKPEAEGIEALIHSAEHGTGQEPLSAIATLARLGDPSAIPTLVRLVVGVHPLPVRIEALAALSKFDDPLARQTISQATEDISVVVRREARRLLNAYEHPR